MAFVIIIVGIVVTIQGTSPAIGTLTQTSSIVNQSVTAPAAGSTSVILNGQSATNLLVINASSGTVIPASNYTVTNYALVNGQLVTQFTSNVGTLGFQGKSINVSYLSEPFGYQIDSGNRAVTTLIPFLSALAIGIVVLGLAFKDSILDMLGS